MRKVPVQTRVQAEPRKAKKRMGQCISCGNEIMPGQWYYPCELLAVDGMKQDKKRFLYVHMDCYLDEGMKGNTTLSPKARQWTDATLKARKIVRDMPVKMYRAIRASAR